MKETKDHVRIRSAFLASVFCCLVTASLCAQPVGVPATLQPATPTTTQAISATTEIPNCMYAELESVVINGSNVRTTIEAAFFQLGAPTPSCYPIAAFGPLPAGNYTYEVYLRVDDSPSTELWSRQSFAVIEAPPAVSSLSTSGLVLLLFSLAAAGVVGARSL